MPGKLLKLIVVGTMCISHAAFAASSKRHRHAPAASQIQSPATDPAAPYKADRLSSSRGERIADAPGQSTVLTRQVLDDMNATSLKDAMRATAGVTIGR
jgi:outer membrane receptor for monomeric catechols